MSLKRYHRVLIQAIDLSAKRWGKRPAELVILNAVSATLDVQDRDEIRRALRQLEMTGFVARRDGRYLVTLQGEQSDFSLPADELRRLESYLAVQFKTSENGLSEEQREILFQVGVAEYSGHWLGASTLAELRTTSLRRAAAALADLAEGGYLAQQEMEAQIAVYGLTRAGKFELRRGDLRLDSIRYPNARSAKAQELIDRLHEVMDGE